MGINAVGRILYKFLYCVKIYVKFIKRINTAPVQRALVNTFTNYNVKCFCIYIHVYAETLEHDSRECSAEYHIFESEPLKHTHV